MTQMVSAQKFQPFELTVPAPRRAATKKPVIDRYDLIVVLAFSAIGLILTLAALARPDLFTPIGIDLIP